jgi:redox-sensitive bicupin YhaK (pirin superfamily)
MNMTKYKISSAVETMEGNGVKVKRQFPIPADIMNYDPFVLWDHFELTPGSGFPEHPHRGFEAITYLFSGSVEHKDNLNNQSTVYAGGAQRFTAGKGIVHSEIPAKNIISTGIQLWINLPRKLKQIEPTYQQVDAGNIQEQFINGVRVRTIVDTEVGIQLHTPVQYLDVTFELKSQYNAHIPTPQRGFIYVVDGGIQIDDQTVKTGDAYYFEDKNALQISGAEGAHIMILSGKPHHEPIYQHGTYVD